MRVARQALWAQMPVEIGNFEGSNCYLTGNYYLFRIG